MVRWEPNARGRLEQAALELYAQQGFEQTTVAEIATRAGLTERTFFRYFADKREVLFPDSLRELFVTTIAVAPRAMAPLDTVALALITAAELIEERRDFSLARYAVISANPALQERELIKLASLAAVIAASLRVRGVTDPAASLTAEAGIAIFKVAFERWISTTNEREFAELIQESLDGLKAVTAGT